MRAAKPHDHEHRHTHGERHTHPHEHGVTVADGSKHTHPHAIGAVRNPDSRSIADPILVIQPAGGRIHRPRGRRAADVGRGVERDRVSGSGASGRG